MEVAGSSVFRQVSCFSSNSNISGSQSRSLFLKQQQRCNRKSSVVAAMAEFSDKGHIQYYTTSSNGIGMMAIKEKKEMMTSEDKKKKKEMKKHLKLLKGLSNNPSVFQELMGFGNGNGGLDDQLRGKMISEATEVLVGELQKLKAEKMELKRMKKEEKAKKKAAAKMMDCKDSSSSSSESECEKTNVTHGETTTTTTTSLMVVDDVKPVITEKMNTNSSIISSLRLDDNNNANANANSNSKIEVCMGGKCKKSGAAMLLENFQKAVGVGVDQVQVVGCKCMGKCKDGPNVKVAAVNNNGNGVGGLGLCMGVRLEDVDSIVNDYLFGVAPPTAPAL